MATTIKSTDLDFDTIKTKLKDYLKSKSEFSDYDFEGAGLSNILDVLAYNTHVNGLTANFALNESFLNTSQLRSSVVSHAEALGYVPKSRISSTAFLNISVTIAAATRPTTITLPRGTQFTATAQGVSYTFRTLESYDATDNGSGLYLFKTKQDNDAIPVYEGVEKKKTFFVGEDGEDSIFVIPDVTMNTNRLNVKVFETASSSTSEEYTNLNTAVRITTASKHYQIKEVPNGYYELIFSDGKTTGKSPSAGNKIEVTYLSTVGAPANEASTFSNTGGLVLSDVVGSPFPLTITTENASADGSDKEGIESIRKNAPLLFASQQRMVTAEDYNAQILATYNYLLDDVISWGGEDNDPVEYGKVYVGLKFKDGVSDTVKTNTKNDIITNLTNNIGVMSIDTEYTDPVTTFLELQTVFNFDPDLTNSTARATEVTVFNEVKKYFDDNLKKFGKVFRRSNLLADIDALDDAILNTRMSVKVQQKFSPTTGQSLAYDIKFPVQLANPDDVFVRINTGRFTFNNRLCTIQNKLESTKLQIVNIDGDVEVDNVGSYNPDTGVVHLEGFNPTAIEGSAQLRVTATPANEGTIRPLRNYVLELDTTLSTATAEIDYQNTQLTL